MQFKKFAWFKEFDAKVKSGVSPTSIARWIQRDLFDFSEISFKNLVEKIKAYRKKLPAGSFKISRRTVLERMTQKFEKDIIELEELKNLYLLQAERIGLLYQREKKYKLPLAQNRQEIALAASLLMKINRLNHETCFEEEEKPVIADEDVKLGMVAFTLRKALEAKTEILDVTPKVEEAIIIK